MANKKCFMYKFDEVKNKYMCDGGIKAGNCDQECPFFKTKEQQKEIEDKIVERLKKNPEKLYRNYVSRLTRKVKVRMIGEK